MKRVVEFPTENGGILLVEVDDTLSVPSNNTLRGGKSAEVTEKARVTIEQALDGVKAAAESIIVKMRSMPHAPNEIDVEFGIKLSAEIGAILAATSAEAQFTLRLMWKREMQMIVDEVHEDHIPEIEPPAAFRASS